jgi:hypothetical protein
MRYYARSTTKPPFNTEVDAKNWYACHSVIERYSKQDKYLLISVYGGYDTLADNVHEVAKTNNIDQTDIWDMIKEFERKIAKKRGLI